MLDGGWRLDDGTGNYRTLIVTGNAIYNAGMGTRGSHAPNPQCAYLGAPVGRSGTEAASIAGTIYRNVWLGNRPRPAMLGIALRSRF